MDKNGKRYSNIFKKKIVDLYYLGSSVSNLSKECVIPNATINRWIKEQKVSKISDKSQISLKNYKKRIAELEMENDILKKATAIFARQR